MHAVVADAASSQVVLIWLLISLGIIMTGVGVAMALTRSAVHRLKLVT